MNEIEQLKEKVRRLEEVITGMVLSDRFVFQRDVQMLDGRDIQVGRSTGTRVGTGTDQKLGFFGHAPIARPDAISSPTTDTSSLKTAVDSIRTTLINLGLTA